MSAEQLSAQCLLMARRETAGGYERLELFNPEHGLLPSIRRVGKKASTTSLPDLFDLCSVALDARRDAWFLREYSVDRRHSGIGASYAALREAAAWSRLVLSNVPHMEDPAPLYTITLNALDAWERGAPAEAIHLKALYLFGRDEGLPVKEQWLSGLPAARRKAATDALSKPAAEVTADPAEVALLVNGLQDWLVNENHIAPPRKI